MSGTSTLTKTGQTVALGLSGGVDSAVCAQLLKAQGYQVTAVYIECWREPGCRAETDKQDAIKIALALDLPFKTLDFRQEYKDQVLNYFLTEYQAGRTPNPDVLCNQVIKFGLFYEWAMTNGFDYIATGHYAQIITTPASLLATNQANSQFQLAASADTHKDQTYFLNLLTADKLSHILFPIGHLTKPAVRQLALDFDLPVAHKKDSVGICFVGDINVSQFLRQNLGEKPGPITDSNGQHLGNHTGLWFYTIGQRHGFTIDTKRFFQLHPDTTTDKQQLPPLYVIGKDFATNTLVVGFDWQRDSSHCTTEPPHWIDQTLVKSLLADQSARLLVRIRHTGELIPITVQTPTDTTLSISFAKPVKGLAAGQSAVFYWQTDTSPLICLGGAVIN